MKFKTGKYKYFIVCILSLVLFYSCDGAGISAINVSNKSSYNLLISIDVDHRCLKDDEIIEINVDRNQFTSFEISCFGPHGYPDINRYIRKITFSNIETNTIIKVFDEDIKSILIFASSRGFLNNTADYIFTITDDLLL